MSFPTIVAMKLLFLCLWHSNLFTYPEWLYKFSTLKTLFELIKHHLHLHKHLRERILCDTYLYFLEFIFNL